MAAVKRNVASGALLPPRPPQEAPPIRFDAPSVVPKIVTGTLPPRLRPGQTAAAAAVGVLIGGDVDVPVGTGEVPVGSGLALLVGCGLTVLVGVTGGTGVSVGGTGVVVGGTGVLVADTNEGVLVGPAAALLI